jgi:threonine dehydratase
VAQAERRIRPYVRETPLVQALALSQAGGADVFLKLENLQHTGSFKLRGAMNKLLGLDAAQRARGVVAASSGNHGAAVAYACQRLGAPALIVVPELAAPAKVEAIRRLGAEVRHYGDDSLLSEHHARQHAERHGLAYISPYNDWDIVAGQGTLAAELARQLDRIDAVFVAVGGGGLIAGVAGYLKVARPGVRVVGCLPENSPVMAASVRAGRLLDMPSLPTFSDGTAGGIEAGAITFELCQQSVDEYVLVSEAEIAGAVRACIAAEHLLVEGAAGVAVAAYLKEQTRFRGQSVAIVICGANIGVETLRQILDFGFFI